MPNPQTTWGKLDKPVDNQINLERFLGDKLYDPLDSVAFGTPSMSLQSLSGTIDLTLAQARNAVIVLTGAPSGAITLRIPANAKATILFANTCTGANSSVTIKSTGANSGNAGGTTILAGYRRIVQQDGDSAYPASLLISPSGIVLPFGLGVRVYNSASLSIPSGSATALTFNSERTDVGGLHDTSSNTDRLTAQADGLYVIWGNAEFAVNGTGVRSLSVRLNAGATSIANQMVVAQGTYNQPVVVSSAPYPLSVGDYVRLFAFQDSGNSLNVLATGNYSPEFGMVKVG